MRNLALFVAIVFVMTHAAADAAWAELRTGAEESWFLKAIHAPRDLAPDPSREPVVIAIVDDGVRLTHRDLEDFIWSNPNEIPFNQIDDDGNGHVDDVHGWDVSDHDGDVSPPKDDARFYHGTHLAGVIAQIARRAYGDAAPERIRILPVKSLADRAQKTYLKDAYAGVEYAIEAGADIILCSWGVSVITPEESKILRRAEDAGILVVASAGNFPEEREQFPAAYGSVLAVGSLDRDGRKLEKSNYGQFLDLSAPGVEIRSASALSDDGYEARVGTSFSAPMVAAAAALIKLQHPSYSPREVAACLKSSAEILELDASRYAGKLGAGSLNVEAAVACELLAEGPAKGNQRLHPKGYLRLRATDGKAVSWTIEPRGTFEAIRLRPVLNRGRGAQGTLEIRESDARDAKRIARHEFSALPAKIDVPGNRAHVIFESEGKAESFDWLIEYEAQTIDFTALHCSGTQEINGEGVIADGSGTEDYAFHSSCKWLITAPEGKVIQFRFLEFDTEANTDLVYFFNGAGTHEKIMAIFSGPNIPPELTTWRNQALVWFVSDEERQRGGWKAEVRFQDR